MASAEQLTILIDGGPVGTVSVTEQTPRGVSGKFSPLPGFEPYRALVEASVELARQFDATPLDQPCDYALWDRMVASHADIVRLRPLFAELSDPIGEFEIDGDWFVEAWFEVPLP